MELANVLRKDCIVADADVRSKSDVLLKIAEVAKRCPVLENVSREEILTALRNREELGSTGFGAGMAIPHCRLESVKEFVVGVITVPDGVDFEAMDKKKVRLFVFIIAPKPQSNRHIQLLSTISRNLSVAGRVDKIISAGDTDGIYRSILGTPEVDAHEVETVDRDLFYVVVEDDEKFHQILEILAGLASDRMTVLESQSVGSYLAKIPLFADMWRDEPSRFGKIILCIVNHGLTNEAIRRIEAVAGDLNKSTGIMLTVQPVYYHAGSLRVDF